jgi:hypothetical protein
MPVGVGEAAAGDRVGAGDREGAGDRVGAGDGVDDGRAPSPTGSDIATATKNVTRSQGRTMQYLQLSMDPAFLAAGSRLALYRSPLRSVTGIFFSGTVL